MASVTFHDVEKAFGTVKAVDGVNFTITEGEFVCLLGPSGCGKTTTLRLIAGLEKATGGSIHIGDLDVTHLAAKDRDIGMVFQDYALYPHMTIGENIGYPLKVRNVPTDARATRIGEVAKNLQIDKLLERRPGEISGGQQQRTSVARAVVHEPQVFLFDEPLSNLDAKLRLEARSFLKHLQREVGVTAVYVTHDQAEAMALADRIAVMNEGRIVQMAPPLEVYHRPGTTFVANFLGSPPMNLLPATVALDGGARFVGEAFTVAMPSHVETAVRQHLSDGAQVTVGIRPEHLGLSQDPVAGGFQGPLYALETLGPESLVTLKVGDELLTVRIFSDDAPQLADTVHAAFDPEKLHVFRENGERIPVE